MEQYVYVCHMYTYVLHVYLIFNILTKTYNLYTHICKSIIIYRWTIIIAQIKIEIEANAKTFFIICKRIEI